MIVRNFILAAALLSLPVSSFADAIFGAAGHDECGIGTMIWGRGSSIWTQSSESSTNMSSGGMFSITTGTSGCKSSGIVRATQEELHYANANFEELKLELAYGEGEALVGFVQALGCEAVASDFLDESKLQYSEIIGNAQESSEVLLRNVKIMIKANPSLSNNCRTII